MDHFVGINVSLESCSVCVLSQSGSVVLEAKVASEPDALIAFLRGMDVTIDGVPGRIVAEWNENRHMGCGGRHEAPPAPRAARSPSMIRRAKRSGDEQRRAEALSGTWLAAGQGASLAYVEHQTPPFRYFKTSLRLSGLR